MQDIHILHADRIDNLELNLAIAMQTHLLKGLGSHGIYVIGFGPLNHQLLLFDYMKSDIYYSYIYREETSLWLYTDIHHTF